MKNFKKYFWILALLLLVFVTLFFLQRKDSVILSTKKAAGLKTFCYQYQADVFSDSGSVLGQNIERVVLNIDGVNLVTGSHVIDPQNSSPSMATIEGVAQGGIANVIASAEFEGHAWKEQRVYRFDEDVLYVGYQTVDVPLYENSKGIYMYEDINEIVFDTEEFFLSRVVCAE